MRLKASIGQGLRNKALRRAVPLLFNLKDLLKTATCPSTGFTGPLYSLKGIESLIRLIYRTL